MSAPSAIHALGTGYAPGEDRPLAAYAVLMGTFGATVGGVAALLRARGRELPASLRWSDLVLLGVTTHKLSRLVAKDRVTSFVRAPFTRYQARAGHGEVEEQARGTGMRLAIGELLICPYCLAQWISAALAFSLVAAPRATRFVSAVYVVETLSDVLQLAYKAAEDRA